MFRSADRFFRPETVAIVGASETGGGGWPRGVYDNLVHERFPVRVYLVNPRREELWGQRVYPDFKSLPEQIDVAVVIIRAEAVVEVLVEAAEAGLRNALVYASRFGEGDDADGRERGEALQELCKATGLRICGPNCMGAVSLPERVLLYPTPRVRALKAGTTGVVFQSGGTFQFWLEQGASRGLSYSYAVSSGNEIDFDMADYVRFLVDDPLTKVIACMAEGVRRPDALAVAAEHALEAGKPLLMLKTGRTSASAAAAVSHTGALAGDDRVFDAFCRKFGIIRVTTLDEMIETALAFGNGRLPKGPRVAMVGYSGGAKGLFLDYADEIGLPIPQFTAATQSRLRELIDIGVSPDNPLDAGAGLARRFEAFAEVCRIAAADDNVDIISVQGQLPLGEGSEGDPLLFRGVRDSTEKPVIAHNRMTQPVTDAGRAFQSAAGIPFLQRLPEVARSLRALSVYARAREQGVKPLKPPLPGSALDPRKLLAERGIQSPPSAIVPSIERTGVIAAEIGFPVAVKIVSPQAVHKTEVGGVSLGITNVEDAVAAARDMESRLLAVHPGAEIGGFLVQKMVSGLEVIVGARDDPQFGPVLAVGLGGILVEVLNDVALRLLPVTEEQAGEMIADLKARKLLGEYRGVPPRDVQALRRAVVALAETYLDLRQRCSDLEINPLVVGAEGEGVHAVDIRVVLRGQ